MRVLNELEEEKMPKGGTLQAGASCRLVVGAHDGGGDTGACAICQLCLGLINKVYVKTLKDTDSSTRQIIRLFSLSDYHSF